jgi:hypothetical protein
VLHPIARRDPETRRGSAVQLDHRANRRHGGDHIERLGYGALADVDDPALRIDEQHVERDQRVAHPHRCHGRRLVVEQHPGVRGHGPSEHQTLLHLPGRFGDLDGEVVWTRRADDRQRGCLEALELGSCRKCE